MSLKRIRLLIWKEFRQLRRDPLLLRLLMLMPVAQLCLLYTSPSPRDGLLSRMPSSA